MSFFLYIPTGLQPEVQNTPNIQSSPIAREAAGASCATFLNVSPVSDGWGTQLAARSSLVRFHLGGWQQKSLRQNIFLISQMGAFVPVTSFDILPRRFWIGAMTFHSHYTEAFDSESFFFRFCSLSIKWEGFHIYGYILSRMLFIASFPGSCFLCRKPH